MDPGAGREGRGPCVKLRKLIIPARWLRAGDVISCEFSRVCARARRQHSFALRAAHTRVYACVRRAVRYARVCLRVCTRARERERRRRYARAPTCYVRPCLKGRKGRALGPRLDVFNKRSTCGTYWILPRHPHPGEALTGVSRVLVLCPDRGSTGRWERRWTPKETARGAGNRNGVRTHSGL